jgi:photosystem II stability/assembly factor-like uncharacterized protein
MARLLRAGSPAVALCALAAAALADASAPAARSHVPTETPAHDARWLDTLEWRNIGPYRGGRVTAVTGVAGQPLVYYMGATGGGIWKTDDAGLTWVNVSDGFVATGSVGALAVAPSDPNIVYAGMGEACLRGNISHGDGVYRSNDAGASWTRLGLADSRHIGRIRIHPGDPDIVYVAAVGHAFGPNDERGLFRSRDGGRSWEHALRIDARTGVVDVALDPRDPRVVYAAAWQVLREPWGIRSGGPGSRLYKSLDGGDTWRLLRTGLPDGDVERIGVSVSPVDPSRVYAMLEADEGGIFRSDDAGATWERVNAAIELRSRSYYYSHIYADPIEKDTVYIFSAKEFYKSTDGGRTVSIVTTPHLDHHDLWIDPADNRRMIDGNDGGATITFNGGRSWSSIDNQPTGQFYAVATDDAFPYRVYGSQQDNTTVSIPSRTTGPGIAASDWYSVGGGESGYLAPKPDDPLVTYGGSYWGHITRYDHRTREVRNITVWPDYPGGRQAADLKYRFQWTFPIVASRHDPSVLYTGGNVVFRTRSEGQRWTALSPDLTRRDPEKLRGGRLEEFYGTLSTIAESPLDGRVLWTGSDDGLVHVTRDAGATWQNVTPPALAPFTRVNLVDASPHDLGTAHVAATRYQLDDYTPTIYRTTDFGTTWSLAGRDLPANSFVRVVREDPSRRGLLYAGTETGVFVSFDAGRRWQSLQRNLPVVPITDLAVKDDDLVASTQGRGFWILDDLTRLHQIDEAAAEPHRPFLFRPRETLRTARGGADSRRVPGLGQNPATGAVISYALPPTTADANADAIRLEILDAAGSLVRRFASRGSSPAIPARPGLNRFVWDLRYPDAEGLDTETFLFGGSLRGPVAPPGRYSVRLTVGTTVLERELRLVSDPRRAATDDDVRVQFEFLMAVRDRVTDTHRLVVRARRLDAAVERAMREAGPAAGAPGVRAAATALRATLGDLLAQLVEARFTGFDDQMLTYDLKLNNRMAALQGYVAGAERPPTDQARAVFDELSGELTALAARFEDALARELPALNTALAAAGRPVVAPPR